MSQKLPIGYLAELIVDFIRHRFEFAVNFITLIVTTPVDLFQAIGSYLPPWMVIISILAIVLKWGKRRDAFIIGGCLIGILFLNLWNESVQTIAITVSSTLFCLVIGIPVGIFAAGNRKLEYVITPILDYMQTTPSFVYLIAVVMIFGMGVVPGIIATMIFAIPPSIRLTILGIREADITAVEAGKALGCNDWQLLWKIKLPLAIPAILTGVNQTIMMSLSMIVVASLIGAPGLGITILVSLGSVDIAKGIDAGICVILLAYVLDRLTTVFKLFAREEERSICIRRKGFRKSRFRKYVPFC